jgi:iron complex transport system permease protein
MKQRGYIFCGIVVLILLLFFCNIFLGTVSIPVSAVMDILFGNEVERSAWTSIVLQSRLPQAITALLAGAALAVCGLLLQTLFQNPLAGPGILGVSNGANLGVAIVMMYVGGSMGIRFSSVLAALMGALAVLGFIIYFSSKVKNNVMVLIIGMMVGYLASSGIAILNSFASADGIRSYVLWGLGSFSGIVLSQLPLFALMTGIGLFASLLLIKPLNLLLLSEQYAANLGLSIQRIRILILLTTGFLTAVVTAYCGPIAFIGLAVPHITRMLLRTSNQQILLPATLLLGAAITLFCNLLTVIPFGQSLLPLNAVTPLLGAPVILYVILRGKNIG